MNQAKPNQEINTKSLEKVSKARLRRSTCIAFIIIIVLILSTYKAAAQDNLKAELNNIANSLKSFDTNSRFYDKPTKVEIKRLIGTKDRLDTLINSKDLLKNSEAIKDEILNMYSYLQRINVLRTSLFARRYSNEVKIISQALEEIVSNLPKEANNQKFEVQQTEPKYVTNNDLSKLSQQFKDILKENKTELTKLLKELTPKNGNTNINDFSKAQHETLQLSAIFHINTAKIIPDKENVDNYELSPDTKKFIIGTALYILGFYIIVYLCRLLRYYIKRYHHRTDRRLATKFHNDNPDISFQEALIIMSSAHIDFKVPKIPTDFFAQYYTEKEKPNCCCPCVCNKKCNCKEEKSDSVEGDKITFIYTLK